VEGSKAIAAEADIESFKMGDVDDFPTFINAVIDEKSFDKITAYIANAKKDKNANVIIGGKSDKSKGYFIQPTVIQALDPIIKPCAKKSSDLCYLSMFTKTKSLKRYWIL
jgi:acyl-CoA reductase-like NAD-dependent aldehyde dehydrogenase